MAQRNGQSVDDNPYNEVTQEFSYHHWMSGWCVRRGAEKHGEDLRFDQEVESLKYGE
jgi:hypothetical protein